MDQKFFAQSFAFAGDVADIPNAVQVDGSVSFNQGWGYDYQRELGVDPLAKPMPRDQTNYLFKVITDSLGQYQRNGSPEFITSADNDGVAYSYDKGATVKWRASSGDPWGFYVSLVATNTAVPSDATKWQAIIFQESSSAQATAGTDATTIMTPRRVAAAIAASSISIPAASETTAGIAEIATQTETNTGTDDTRFVTPLKLATAIPAATTATAGRSRYATTVETAGMTVTNAAVTPASLTTLMASKANLASPTFTGTPTGPTAAAGTNTTQLATTAFVYAGLALKANLSGADFTGAVSAPQYTATNSSFIGSSTTAILASSGAGVVYLRPNGAASATGQVSLSSSGALAAPSTISAESAITTGGSGAAFNFKDRTTPTTVWTWYSTGGSARLFVGSSDVVTVTTAGQLSAVSFNTTSSRLVKDLEPGPAPYGLKEVLQIETAAGKYKADYIDDGRRRLFLIAENLRDVLPEAVFEESVEVTLGGEKMSVPTVEMTQTIPVLVNAIKELSAALDEERQQRALLASRLDALEI